MIQEFLFDRDGGKRRAERVGCICGQTFLRRIKTGQAAKQKFCSTKCAGMAGRDRVQVQCTQCGTKCEKTPTKLKNSVHGIYFCSRSCKDKGQSLNEGKSEKIRPSHYKHGKYIKYRKEIKGKVCSCGEKREMVLVVHHKDGNRDNNSADNWEVVCWNCHALRHMRNIEGEWYVHFQSLTPREILSSF